MRLGQASDFVKKVILKVDKRPYRPPGDLIMQVKAKQF
jgi:hypothetical protein